MAEKQEPIPIGTLPLAQLEKFQKDIEGRCEQLAEAVGQLMGASARYDNIRDGITLRVALLSSFPYLKPFLS